MGPQDTMSSERDRNTGAALCGPVRVPIRHKRRNISDEQRKALRDYRRHTTPAPSYRDMITWFSQRYDGRVLGYSTLGHCLCIEFDYLDTTNEHDIKPEGGGEEKWPELEEALLEWTRRHVAAMGEISSGFLYT